MLCKHEAYDTEEEIPEQRLKGKNLIQLHALQEFTNNIRNETNTKTTKQVI